MMKINEIYQSIQGESSYVGWPTVFVRTSGCHLRCTYCDTAYAFYEGQKLSLDDVLTKVSNFSVKHICITGGEPLLQKEIFELMKQLCDREYLVSLETSGSLSCELVDVRVKKIVDVKTPNSGEADSFLMENLKFCTPNDEFKFVICSEQDFEWTERFVKAHALSSKHVVFYSPSFKKISEKWLAEKILAAKSTARLQLQLHKYIWSDITRGV
ncbi:MAG: radical SAM protein [Bdellovibrionales bacterium]